MIRTFESAVCLNLNGTPSPELIEQTLAQEVEILRQLELELLSIVKFKHH